MMASSVEKAKLVVNDHLDQPHMTSNPTDLERKEDDLKNNVDDPNQLDVMNSFSNTLIDSYADSIKVKTVEDPQTGYTSIVPNSGSVEITKEHNIFPETKTYKRRWYILFLFFMLGCIQNIIWNTWGPLADSMKRAFEWEDSTVALMTNWGAICYVFAIVPCVWLMDVKGMRIACLSAAFLSALGAGLRCITSEHPAFTWLAHAGQFLNALLGPIPYGGPPVISANWFPPNQRTTATALGSIGTGLGVALSFIIGPMLVPDAHNHSNTTHNQNTSDIQPSHYDITAIEDHYDVDVLNSANLSGNSSHSKCGLASAIFVAMVIYFPARPPLPPSVSAAAQRVDFISGLKHLFRNRRFWMLGLSFALSVGVYGGWTTVLDVNLGRVNVSQDDAGWIGFYGNLVGFGAGLIISLCADVFSRRMRLFLIGLFSVGITMFLVFSLVVAKVIPCYLSILYVTNILGSTTVAGASPLFFELVCEATYPIAEGITNGFLTWMSAITQFAFLITFMFPVGLTWVNWALLGSLAVCLPIFLMYRERYSRLDLDTAPEARDTNQGGVQNDTHQGGVQNGKNLLPS